MTALPPRLSVPAPRKTAPRPLTSDEAGAARALADALCGPNPRADLPSAHEQFLAMLDVALAARSDSFDIVVGLLARAPANEDRQAWLRALHDEDQAGFQVLSAVLGGAYLLVPSVREAVGYPGQRRDPAGLEEAVDEIADGILDPVLERGHFYVAPPEES